MSLMCFSFVCLFYEDLLWKAPELLREYSQHARMRDFQKADVYSFAIILQECHTRNGPWSLEDESAEGKMFLE